MTPDEARRHNTLMRFWGSFTAAGIPQKAPDGSRIVLHEAFVTDEQYSDLEAEGFKEYDSYGQGLVILMCKVRKSGPMLKPRQSHSP